MLDLSDRLIVIVGGGAVAVRKAEGVRAAGATKVRVVSPAVSEKMPAAVEWIPAAYHVDQLADAGLVFAATNLPSVNDLVVRDCRAQGIWVNRADADAALAGDFSTPALLKQGSIAVTISAGSPALSATIRDSIRKTWDARWTAMADAMQTIRPMIVRRTDWLEAQRTEIFRALATEEALVVVGERGLPALMEWLSKRFNVLIEAPNVD